MEAVCVFWCPVWSNPTKAGHLIRICLSIDSCQVTSLSSHNLKICIRNVVNPNRIEQRKTYDQDIEWRTRWRWNYSFLQKVLFCNISCWESFFMKNNSTNKYCAFFLLLANTNILFQAVWSVAWAFFKPDILNHSSWMWLLLMSS
jgi:hypothetical protein